MIKEWDKSFGSLKEKFYELPESEAARLHPARHLPSMPRLCCVLQQDDTPLWTTMCLSDFIRPRKMKNSRSSVHLSLSMFSKTHTRSFHYGLRLFFQFYLINVIILFILEWKTSNRLLLTSQGRWWRDVVSARVTVMINYFLNKSQRTTGCMHRSHVQWCSMRERDAIILQFQAQMQCCIDTQRITWRKSNTSRSFPFSFRD